MVRKSVGKVKGSDGQTRNCSESPKHDAKDSTEGLNFLLRNADIERKKTKINEFFHFGRTKSEVSNESSCLPISFPQSSAGTQDLKDRIDGSKPRNNGS